MKKSFTLIELLIVIGILAILVVTILITLNPSEAQKKARDAKRMKDLATLQALALQWINDGNAPISTSICPSTETTSNGPTVCISNSAGQVQSQPCNNNWITGNSVSTGIDLCRYTNSIPVDPLNNRTSTYVYQTPPNPIQVDVTVMRYRFGMSGSNYKIGVMQESKADVNNVALDGGNYPNWAEAFSGPDALTIW